MVSPRLRLDPALPVCWEDPHTLRIGFDRAAVRLTDPTPAVQRLLGLLRAGIRPDAVVEATRRAGATPQQGRALLARLSPVLRVTGDDTEAPPPRVHVSAPTGTAEPFRLAVERAGWEEIVPAPLAAEAADLVVLVERYIEPPARAHRWLMLGVPHLRVRLSDRSVRVGPLVPRDGSPCLSCADLHAAEADPALPALAAQLSGRVPASETPAVGEVAAASALALIRRWRAGVPGTERHELRFPVEHGLVSGLPRARRVRAHPGCLCGAGEFDQVRTAPDPVGTRSPAS